MKPYITKLHIYLILTITFFCTKNTVPNADLIIFSYNRPLQLYALLESTENYITHLGSIQIIYRAGDKDFAVAYQKVALRFPSAQFYLQSETPYQDFRPMTIQALNRGSTNYVLFAVDDNIVKDFVNLDTCILALEKTGAYGFYLRLGKNLSYCYPCEKNQPIPPLQPINPDIFSWQFNHASMDWGYPHTVDMTIYRKSDVLRILQAIPFTYPNTLECAWSGQAHKIITRTGLCYNKSQIVNIPANRIQQGFHSKSMDIDPRYLLQIFNKRKKIDIKPLHKIDNKSAHMTYNFGYIDQ